MTRKLATSALSSISRSYSQNGFIQFGRTSIATKGAFNKGGDMKFVSWLWIEWKDTSRIGKSLVVIWLIAITLIYGFLMEMHPFYEYLRPKLLLGWLYIWFLFVMLPFVIAAMARKRGGRFNTWFACSCFFTPLPYIIYWFSIRKRPIVTQQNSL